MKLNICLVTFELPPFHWMGGEGTYTAGLHEHFSKLGHQTTTLVTDIQNKDSPKIPKRPDVILVPTINRRPLRLLSFYLKANSTLREIAKSSGSMDVIHYTNDYCGPILSERDIHKPVIVTMHHPYVAERGSLSSFGYRDATYFFTILSKFTSARNACRKATKIVAVSKFTAQGIVAGYSIPREKIAVIPNGVDTRRFNPRNSGQEIREKWKLGTEPLVVYVGRLARNKGLDFLIEAFAELLTESPDAKLAIVGEEVSSEFKKETTLEELRTIIGKHRLQESVMLTGKVSEEDLPKIYAAADLVVLPSLMEGFGMVLLEAMATSKPCVATTVGGIPEVIVNGDTGILVRPSDSAALAEAISTVVCDRKLSRRLGESGRRRVENNFTWDIVAKETISLYEQALENRS